MSNYAVRVNNLGKMYRIGGPQESYQTFRDAITRAVTAPFSRAKNLLRGQAYGAAELSDEIWALKDVSFDIQHGEVVGIIGRNGAGKSTLLKILSQITEPTEGHVDIYGRVGALLEVGTGFHPELTGRENVYLNGAILGMSRSDIDRKFDEIVDFSGVAKFIDTPVKHYSSGMGLRLGFSVAAHLEPDILVVDEVLAVGDAEFQKKCLGKMSDVAGEGRTVLFVSHNMLAVTSLCSRAIWLQDGIITADDESTIIVNRYIGDSHQKSQEQISVRTDRTGTGTVRFKDIEFANVENHSDILVSGSKVRISVDLNLTDNQPIDDADVVITFVDSGGTTMFAVGTTFNHKIGTIHPNQRVICHIERFPLVPGEYSVNLWAGNRHTFYDRIESAARFEVKPGDFFNSGKLVRSRKHGNFLVDHTWELE